MMQSKKQEVYFMKTRRFLSCLLLVLLLTFSLMPAAFAEVVFSGEQENLSGELDATVFLAGSDPVNSAEVKGILFAAGNSVSSGGSSEYAFLAGNTVALSGQNSRDAFIGGNTVSFSGSCARDLYAAGNALEIRGTVGRDLVAGGKNVVLSGAVEGNVFLAAEVITITGDAKIGGTLRYNSSAKITAPAELLSGAEVYDDQKSESDSNAAPVQSAAPEKSSSVLPKVKSVLCRYIGLLLIAYFLLWLTPLWEKVDGDYTGKSFGCYAGAFGIGFAVLAGLPLASILLMITGFGLRPAFVLLLVFVSILIPAPIFLGFFLGSLLWRKALKKARNYWAELAVGLLIWLILSLIPGAKFAVALVAGPLALGVFTRMLGKKRTTPPAAESPALPQQGAAE